MLFSRVQFTAGPANWAGTARGVTPDYFVAREWAVAEGREMTAEDHARAAKVVLLGATVRDKLFGDVVDPVGVVLRVRDAPYTIIGVLERKGQSLEGDDHDDVALIPLSTARQQLTGINRASPRFVHSLLVKYAERVPVDDVMSGIAELLRDRHRVQPGQEDTFLVRNFAEVADAQAAAARTLSLLLAAVASVALLVGGIGIMNIMLVSVTERTREIGLRMAVGARGRDILTQFLVEASTLALLGGCVGVLVGIGGSFVMATIAGWPVRIDLGAVIVAVVFAGAVGVFFGFYPARQAARLNPIDALHYE
jgi:putative ABC transport system permease protein